LKNQQFNITLTLIIAMFCGVDLFKKIKKNIINTLFGHFENNHMLFEHYETDEMMEARFKNLDKNIHLFRRWMFFI
jgi:hypothetical protein